MFCRVQSRIEGISREGAPHRGSSVLMRSSGVHLRSEGISYSLRWIVVCQENIHVRKSFLPGRCIAA
jgi:hypothetical protein